MTQLRQSKGLYFFVPKQFEAETDILISFTALSHGQLLSLEPLIAEQRHNEFTYQTCKLSIVDIEDNQGNLVNFTTLSPKTLAELSNAVLVASSVTQDELDILSQSINIKFGKEFQAETWNCEVCQHKRLDRVRNCGFRGEKEKDPSFRLQADNQVYKYCPIYEVDADVLADAVDSYVMYDKQLLPDVGGLYDQTRFFVLSSSLVKNKLRSEEEKEAKAAQRKSKR